MKDIILKVENISKQYRLGLVGTGSLMHDINRWWYKIRGKEDPYLKIGEVNDRASKGQSDYVWALKDINFEVSRGEIVGIIGKNGAGKSTLLKLLSRVTAPTTGSIKFGGRVASLLEVGTGFNGEMTGKENIYLNGAILGMTKKEITSKLDEIIEFSGCERYIDTPVKRYSSGMYVRLAFAVAAFLEPEILIVDEVLAVGDAEFQKKAIGKMQDISKQGGRTVLFVSHNMAAVKQLCNRGIILEQGKVIFDGGIDQTLEKYLKANLNDLNDNFYGNGIIKRASLKFCGEKLFYNTTFKLEVFFESNVLITNPILGIVIKDLDDVPLIGVNNRHYLFHKLIKESIYSGEITVEIDKLKLFPGVYKLDLFLGDSTTDLEVQTDVIQFEVVEDFQEEIINTLNFKINKIFHPNVKWECKTIIIKIEE
ncbi:ABC transporter ATP-binding protein [Flavobacterium sp. 7A]|uniref:ABC transporter ATP-binding protein n=1 Tax=Flavobacterium sp. 7A TaxID=2940571 RepID=UPI0022280C95|nr:ABC transporter ATP-binding protein [Flavobacterium sp. 7A]MCW2119431.1 lipopolysaccharide transport system ATP-binding protein [Flavobacterium sp. 7A]